MNRRLTLALAAGALVVAMVPGAASAGSPQGMCPTGAWWYEVQPRHGLIALDVNGDTYLCRLDLPNGDLVFIDNVVRVR